MSFFAPKNMRVGGRYVLTETVKGVRASSGSYYLITVAEGSLGDGNPVLGFSEKPPENGLRPSRYAQPIAEPSLGVPNEPAWRFVFNEDGRWYPFLPEADTVMWSDVHVTIEELPSGS